MISPAFDVPELQSMGMPVVVIDLPEMEGGLWIVYQVVNHLEQVAKTRMRLPDQKRSDVTLNVQLVVLSSPGGCSGYWSTLLSLRNAIRSYSGYTVTNHYLETKTICQAS